MLRIPIRTSIRSLGTRTLATSATRTTGCTQVYRPQSFASALSVYNVANARHSAWERTNTAYSMSLSTIALSAGILASTVSVSVAYADSNSEPALSKEEISAATAAIHDLLDNAEDDGLGPTLVRLAWHASGTYDKDSHTGGSDGATMRFEPECNHEANAGLKIARDALEPVKKLFPQITYVHTSRSLSNHLNSVL